MFVIVFFQKSKNSINLSFLFILPDYSDVIQMNVFYGAAIQGAEKRKERAHIHQFIIDTLKNMGHTVVTEHTTGKTYDEAIQKLEDAIGKLPPKGLQRRIYVRDKMIEGIEGDIDAAVFEVSTPSLGTGIEIAHAYLRPRMGLSTVPVIAFYQKDYWPNKLSTMIQGISKEQVPHFKLKEYKEMSEIPTLLNDYLNQIN